MHINSLVFKNFLIDTKNSCALYSESPYLKGKNT